MLIYDLIFMLKFYENITNTDRKITCQFVGNVCVVFNNAINCWNYLESVTDKNRRHLHKLFFTFFHSLNLKKEVISEAGFSSVFRQRNA